MSPSLNNAEHHSLGDSFSWLNLNQKSSDWGQTVQSSAVRVLKRKTRVKDFTNYFQGTSWPFFLWYLWPLCASLRALVLWDPLANILSLPTFSWLRREKSVCNQGPEALNLPSKIKLDETVISCQSHLLELFVMILSFPCRVESWPESYICTVQWVLFLIKPDYYRTFINVVQVSDSYLMLIDPSCPLHIPWSWHISCLKTSRLERVWFLQHNLSAKQWRKTLTELLSTTCKLVAAYCATGHCLIYGAVCHQSFSCLRVVYWVS